MAVKDPSKIRWRLGCVSSEKQPPVVLEKLPVCGNCHSFSQDGKVLGMDVDYANDKGSYVTAAVVTEMLLTQDKLITWSAYKSAEGGQTFGLLSQVSPDGRYVISTVKDRSVFLARPGLEFSQLFFPIQGILAVYDRQTGGFASLPGADDPDFVQSNPVWSPDGKAVVFARSRAYKLRNPVRTDAVLLRQDECNEFLKEGMTFQYDLYRIPFNSGRGGRPEPLKGASQNGKSNYFPKYSPDGKWIVFCKAASFMLLQPDSELFLLPADGGDARRLDCNLPRMNSWHSWSPNSRWLVFSSKLGTPYTRLFLTHIDDSGTCSPPALLDRFTEPGRAANIPEFVNLKAGGIRSIRQQFIDDVSFIRAGNAYRDGGEPGLAVGQYKKALELNPANATALVNLGTALSDLNELQEAAACLNKAVGISPTNAAAYYNLSIIAAKQGNFAEAIRLGEESASLDPASAHAQSNLGLFLLEEGRLDEALVHLSEAVRLDPKKDNAYFGLGRIMIRKGRLADALQC
jgi:tetratricopeptide (TPR) repeat protein